jgi:hypothetical protein
MIRRAAITLLAVMIAAYRIGWRRRVMPAEVSAREIIAAREVGGDPGPAVRDSQAAWLRDQELITADSVVSVVQLARGSITHAGAADARAVLDDLQRQAADHPEGVPGYVVAAGRVRFDELMRGNLQ